MNTSHRTERLTEGFKTGEATVSGLPPSAKRGTVYKREVAERLKVSRHTFRSTATTGKHLLSCSEARLCIGKPTLNIC